MLVALVGGVVFSRDYLDKFVAYLIVVQRVLYYHSHIQHGRVVVVVVQTAGVGKVRAGKAKLFHLSVHQLYKFFFRACNVVRQTQSSVSAAGQHSAVEQVFYRYLFARGKSRYGSVRVGEGLYIALCEFVCI